MNIEEFRDYCLMKQGASETFPFDKTTLVFKVMNKMFALTNLEGGFSINLKCDPEIAISLREQHPSVTPGYHMNKKHWITVIVNGGIEDEILYKWVDNSYKLVVDSLPVRLRKSLGELD